MPVVVCSIEMSSCAECSLVVGPELMRLKLGVKPGTEQAHPKTRVGQGLIWWQVCPSIEAYWASFWPGIPRQMYAKVLPEGIYYTSQPGLSHPAEDPSDELQHESHAAAGGCEGTHCNAELPCLEGCTESPAMINGRSL